MKMKMKGVRMKMKGVRMTPARQSTALTLALAEHVRARTLSSTLRLMELDVRSKMEHTHFAESLMGKSIFKIVLKASGTQNT